MTAKPRFLGNMLEYATARALAQLGGVPRNNYTETKYKKWSAIYTDQLCESSKMPSVEQYNHSFKNLKIDVTKPIEFELLRDTREDTTDIYIYNNDNKIPISLKNRNCKIRHQRPKALYKQLELDDADTFIFQTKYNEINDKYYNRWNNNQFKLFNQLELDDKHRLYEEVMTLTIEWLNRSPIYMTRYLKFLLQSTTKNTMCWYPEKKKFICIPATPYFFNWYQIDKDSTFIYITTDALRLKVRMHNASSRITPKLQLKYDTSLDAKY